MTVTNTETLILLELRTTNYLGEAGPWGAQCLFNKTSISQSTDIKEWQLRNSLLKTINKNVQARDAVIQLGMMPTLLPCQSNQFLVLVPSPFFQWVSAYGQ